MRADFREVSPGVWELSLIGELPPGQPEEVRLRVEGVIFSVRLVPESARKVQAEVGPAPRYWAQGAGGPAPGDERPEVEKEAL